MLLPSLLVLLPLEGWSGSVPQLHTLTEHRQQSNNVIDIVCAGGEQEG